MSTADDREGEAPRDSFVGIAAGLPQDRPLNALSLTPPTVKQVTEAALMAAGGPLTVQQILGLYADDERPAHAEVEQAIADLREDYAERGIELVEVAGGWRVQVRRIAAPRVARLWEEKPARYSRALLETLALIAYRQPITRGEIEEIRGVSVSTQIVKTLTERDWVRVVGHRDVPGRPALFATTRRFLDYFGLRSLNDLPTLAEIRDPAFLGDELDLDGGGRGGELVDKPADDRADDQTGLPPPIPPIPPGGTAAQANSASEGGGVSNDEAGDDAGPIPGDDRDGQSS
ncbi:MAG: SMC-Scp complex subunit ScpB [Thiohalocapsa sp.]|nr:SMC-Scp complex subunit ScpB [Thiohalocapsa sp.]MCF7991397.1 SMC-Scp complex subunit ScpB [Thiohalocapsa sp.]